MTIFFICQNEWGKNILKFAKERINTKFRLDEQHKNNGQQRKPL